MNSLLARIKYGSYKKSKRAKLYEELAKKYNVRPQHVYEIAHGKHKESNTDDKIFNDLLQRGIVSLR